MISVNELTILSVRSFIMLNCPPRVKKYGIKASGATNIEKKSNKKVYLNKTKILIIEKKNKKRITKELLKNNVKTKHYIYTNEDIEKVIRKKF